MYRRYHHTKIIGMTDDELNEFRSKKILAFAGIGNPENFFATLTNNGLDVKKTISYPDHYNFTKSELQKIVDISEKNNFEILTTEKDFHRIKDYGIDKINYLEIELEILKKDEFIRQIVNNI